MNLYASAEYVNLTEGYRMGGDGIQETFTDSVGALYRFCVKEYGRCVSKVYIDGLQGHPKAIGWCFVKRCKYEETGKEYLRETWITLHDAPDTGAQ